MPGYALKLYTPKAFMKKLKQEIPRYMVWALNVSYTLDCIYSLALWSRRALLTCLKGLERGPATQERRAAKPKHTSASSSQAVHGQRAPPQRLLLSMMSCLFVLKARSDPLMTEVFKHGLLLCILPALCAAASCY